MKLLLLPANELRHPLLEGVKARMEAGEWRELRRSVEKMGVKVPIIARATEDGLLIVDGLRRAAAALLRDPETRVPVLVLAKSDLKDLEGEEGVPPLPTLTLLANAVRDRNPIAEYRAIKELREAGLTQERIAELLGVDRTTIAHRLRLDRVLPELLEEAEKGRIPYSVLRRLPSYGEEVQREVLRRVRAGERIRVRDVEEARKAEKVMPVDLSAVVSAAPKEVMGPKERAARALKELKEALEDLNLGDYHEAAWTGIEAIEAALGVT